MSVPTTNLSPDSLQNEADRLIIQSLAKLDKTALGIAMGVVFGGVIFFATNVLVWKGGETVGPNLALLSQYFIGFEVSPTGSLIGAVYGFFTGFVLGWLIAFLRNSVFTLYLHVLKLKSNLSAANDFIDNP